MRLYMNMLHISECAINVCMGAHTFRNGHASSKNKKKK